jgi:outer membrane protein OmpA-like peptidoglycan-associated protein
MGQSAFGRFGNHEAAYNRSNDFEDGMTTKNSRKTPVLAMAAISTATLAIFCGPASAEPVAGMRVAQDAPTPPSLTPEQKLKFEAWKKKRLQQQQQQQPGAQPPPEKTAPPPPPKPPTTAVKPPPPVTPPAVVPKVATPPPPAPKPPMTPNVAPEAKPQPAPVVRPAPPPVAPPVKIVNPPPQTKPAVPDAPPVKVVTPPLPPGSPPGSVKKLGDAPPSPPLGTPPNGAKPPVPGTPPIAPPAKPGEPPKAATPPPPSPIGLAPNAKPPVGVPAKPVVPVVKNLEEAKTGRVEKVEAGGNRTVIKEADKRVIVRQGDKVVIQKDEAAQMQRVAPGAVVTRGKLGVKTAVVERPNNVQIVNETDRNGQLIRRFRRDANGNEADIIDNRQHKKDHFGRNLAIGLGVGAGIIAGAAILNSVVDVPPPVVNVPREKYVVRYEDANEDDVYEALNAPPMEESERRYTLNQVRATPHLRDRMRRIDLDDINFETGSWDVDPSEYSKLERVARAMKRVIERNPNEVFLIEGYTDAIGSDVDNLTLSDRRAESVSVVLTEQFEVPFENLTTQGYGEQYLKVEIDGPERANRRVAVRRVTPLLAQQTERAEAPPPPRRYEDRNGDEDQRDRWRHRHWRRHHQRYNHDY